VWLGPAIKNLRLRENGVTPENRTRQKSWEVPRLSLDSEAAISAPEGWGKIASGFYFRRGIWGGFPPELVLLGHEADSEKSKNDLHAR